MAFPKPTTFASTSTSTSNASSASASSSTRHAPPRAPVPPAVPKRRVHFNESPLMYTYTPPATPIVTPYTTPPWSPPANNDNDNDNDNDNNDDNNDDDDDGEEEEETDEDTDEGPCTPPSNTGLGFPPTPTMQFPKLPSSPYSAAAAGGGGVRVRGSSLYDSPKKSPNNPSNLTPAPTPTPSPSPLLFDPSTMKSQLVWDVRTPPTSARTRVPAHPNNLHNLNNGNLDLEPSSRARRGGELESEMVPLPLSQSSLLQNAATLPGLTSLEVHIPQLPPFWKPIQLQSRASASASSAGVVTISDLVTAVHKYLQTPITRREFNILPESVQKSVARAYWRRYDDAVAVAAGRDETEAKRMEKTGVCRVDGLAGNTQFVAFVPAPQSQSTWQVILAAPAAAAAPALKR